MSGAIGAVLAGGAGERMGEPKAAIELGGRSLIEHALAAVEAAGLEAMVVAKPSTPLPRLPEEEGMPLVVREPERPRHPLLGVVTALRRAGGGAVVIVACDMPFVPPALLAWLAVQRERLIVCESGGRLHPLLGRYEPSLHDQLADSLERSASVENAVRALEPRIVGPAELARFGDPEIILFNLNTPEDLDRASRLFGHS